MESDDFTRNYIIRYLSAHELVLPLNWDMYCSKTDWFQEISAWVAENGAMFTLEIFYLHSCFTKIQDVVCLSIQDMVCLSIRV